MACAGATVRDEPPSLGGRPKRCIWPPRNALQPKEALERKWHLRADGGRAGGGTHGEEKSVMIDATYRKAHQTPTSMAAKKGGRGRQIARTMGGMNTKLHSICDSQGRPIDLFATAEQVSD